MSRSICLDIIRQAEIEKGVPTTKVNRAAYSSTSIYSKVMSGETTTYETPHHRVIGTYFTGRGDTLTDTMFYGDSENEFLVLTQGLKFVW